MKNQGIKLAIIALAIVSVFGCGKKGKGGAPAKARSTYATCTGGLCTGGGNMGYVGKSIWMGQLRVSDMTRFRQFMLDSGGCVDAADCKNLQTSVKLAVKLEDGSVPGIGSFQLETSRASGGYGGGQCNLSANGIPVAASSNNRGILFNYNVRNSFNNGCGGSDNRRYIQDPRNSGPRTSGGTLQIVTELRRSGGATNSGYSQNSQVPTSIYYRGARIASGTLVDYSGRGSSMGGGYPYDDPYYGDDYWGGNNGYHDDDYYGHHNNKHDDDDDDGDDLKYFALKILDKWLDRKFYDNSKDDRDYEDRY